MLKSSNKDKASTLALRHFEVNPPSSPFPVWVLLAELFGCAQTSLLLVETEL